MTEKDNVESYLERYEREKERRSNRLNLLRKKQRYLMNRGEKFTITMINGNYTLTSDLFQEKTFRKGAYTPKELHFFKEVRSYVKKNQIHLEDRFLTQYFKNDVMYVDARSYPAGKEFTDVVEIDIDQAYWQSAYMLGIISEEIYLRGAKGQISKQARMTALGGLAKKKVILSYEGKTCTRTVEADELLENLWFTICKRVSDVMQKARKGLGNGFYFYWVDGIYIQNDPEQVARITELFTSAGYNCKIRPIEKIVYNKSGFVVHDGEGKTRPFSYPKNKMKQRREWGYNHAHEIEDYLASIMDSKRDFLRELETEIEITTSKIENDGN